jgi:hypothetical protein
MRFELVGEAKKVWLMSWSSRFAMLATASELLDQLRDNLPSLQAYSIRTCSARSRSA